MVEEIELNKYDIILLKFCMDKRRSVGEIARFLNTTPASVSFKIHRKLKNLLNINRKGRGKKTYVLTNQNEFKKIDPPFIEEIIIEEIIRCKKLLKILEHGK